MRENGRQRLSSVGAQRTPAPVTLPSDLPGSLKCLDDAQIQTLFEAVAAEINRRQRTNSQAKPGLAEAPGTSPQSAAARTTTRGPGEIPEAKENLIRASFQAGLRPVAIARTLRIPQAV